MLLSDVHGRLTLLKHRNCLQTTSTIIIVSEFKTKYTIIVKNDLGIKDWHEKCIKVSTNMPMFGHVVREMTYDLFFLSSFFLPLQESEGVQLLLACTLLIDAYCYFISALDVYLFVSIYILFCAI